MREVIKYSQILGTISLQIQKIVSELPNIFFFTITYSLQLNKQFGSLFKPRSDKFISYMNILLNFGQHGPQRLWRYKLSISKPKSRKIVTLLFNFSSKHNSTNYVFLSHLQRKNLKNNFLKLPSVIYTIPQIIKKKNNKNIENLCPENQPMSRYCPLLSLPFMEIFSRHVMQFENFNQPLTKTLLS